MDQLCLIREWLSLGQKKSAKALFSGRRV